MNLRFEWNKDKAERNIDKHHVSFNEAKTVFDDPLAYILDDEEHSTAEEKREVNHGSLPLKSFAVGLFHRTITQFNSYF